MIDAAAFSKLATWTSPSYPIGAFSYSHGLEWSVESGDVTDAATLENWIAALLRHGAGWTDSVVIACSMDTVTAGSEAGFVEIADLSAAMQPSAERALETTAQGRAFLDATRSSWPSSTIDRYATEVSGPLTYPVAFALGCAAHDIPKDAALIAYLNGFKANLVSAGVRLIPLGQTDGQRITAALMPLAHEVAEAAESASIDDCGGAAFWTDIASMKHETQYTRLFRS